MWSQVNHSAAVGTNRTEVFDWVDDVLLTDRREWLQMVDVNIALSRVAIHRTKFESTHDATGSVVSDAFLPSYRIALECVNLNSKAGALNNRLFQAKFFLKGPCAGASNS